LGVPSGGIRDLAHLDEQARRRLRRDQVERLRLAPAVVDRRTARPFGDALFELRHREPPPAKRFCGSSVRPPGAPIRCRPFPTPTSRTSTLERFLGPQYTARRGFPRKASRLSATHAALR